MAYKLKGFIQLTSSISDTPSDINTFGEISTQSLTYSRNKKIYTDNNVSNKFNLISFYTKDTNSDIDVPLVVREKLFEISNWISTTQTGINAYGTRSSFLNELTNIFSTSITGVSCGELVTNVNGISFPEWIGFSQLGIPSIEVFSSNEIKVWYSDSSFKLQYDESELVVIPPVKVINELLGNRTSVDTKLNDFILNDSLNEIQLAKGDLPESSILSDSYLWVDRNDNNNRLNTRWIILVYGRIVDNQDYVKLAIRNYISAHSSEPESIWKIVLPDIYSNTEFLIFPKWENYAIRERQLQIGQHSPIVNVNKEISYLKAILSEISDSHIDLHTEVLPTQYKSLSVISISNTSNRDNIYSLLQTIPDYLNIPTTSILFELMAPLTKDWILKLGTALTAADTIGTYDNAPVGMRKIVRNNILFISFKLNNIEYLVSSKATTPNYI